MFRAVLLDFYGTVVNEDDHIVADICEQVRATTPQPDRLTAKEIDARWWRTFQEGTALASQGTFRTHREIALSSLRRTVRHFGSSADAEILCARQFAYWRQPDLFADARTFLHALDLPVCVVSNIDRGDLQAAVDHHRLPLACIITSEDARSYKPHSAIFQAALSALGLPAEQVLHIGDSVSADIVGAHAVGVPAVWINRSHTPRRNQHTAIGQVDDLAAVLPIVALR